MTQNDEIEKKLNNEEYKELLYQKHPVEYLEKKAFSEFITNYLSSGHTRENFIDEFLPLDEEELDDDNKSGTIPKTVSRWKSMNSYPNSTHLKKLKENGAFGESYNVLFKKQVKNLIKEEEEEYRFYHQKIELDESLKQSIINELRESESELFELSDSMIYLEDDGNFYILKEKPFKSIAKDEIEAKLFSLLLHKGGVEKAQRIIEKVNRASLNVWDGGQSIVPIEEFLNLHHASSEISFLFTDLFKYLYEQELKDNISYNEYEDELQKKLNFLKNSLVIKKLSLD